MTAFYWNSVYRPHQQPDRLPYEAHEKRLGPALQKEALEALELPVAAKLDINFSVASEPHFGQTIISL